jgi:hypothetical protein
MKKLPKGYRNFPMQRNYGWLEVAEYLSIVASVMGAVAAVATQKAALMAAPMSMSLMLNLLHRRKLLSLSRQIIGAEVTEQCQDLSHLVTGQPSSRIPESPREKQQIQQGLAEPSECNIASLPLAEMETSLERLCKKFEHQQTEIGQLMVNLEKMSHKIPFNLTNNLTNLPSQSDANSKDCESYKDCKDCQDCQAFNHRNLPSNGYVGAEISGIKTELIRVYEKLTQLQRKTDNLVQKKNLNL